MKIGIDARMYGPETAKGLGRYIERLIHHFEQISDEDTFVVFLRKENFEQYYPQSSRFKKVLADFPWYGWREQLLFPTVIERENLDLMHFPHFNVPLLYHGPFVVTIHDLILFRFPTVRASTLGALTFWAKYGAYRFVLRHAVKNAKAILTVSHATENDLVQAFPVVRGKLNVIYEGADSVEDDNVKHSVLCSTTLSVDGPEETMERFGITKPYLLYVGNAYPHKNLERLVRVFEKIYKKTNGAYQLVLVGKHDYFYRRLMVNSTTLRDVCYISQCCGLKSVERQHDIIFTNHVSQGFLADLYRHARLYVFPSLLEGFGLPGLEAMQYGLPVVSSNRGALPEVYGDAALYFDPENEEAMEQVIMQGLTDESVRQALIKKGVEQVKKYRWETCARETLAIYRSFLQH